MRNFNSKKFIKRYKDKAFKGEWPTLVDIFRIQAIRYSRTKCFETFSPEHKIFTYGESLKIVKKIANGLKERGVKKGDNVALFGKNSPEWALCYLGILFANATVVPIDNELSCDEITNLLNFAEVNFIFCDSDKIDKVGDENKVTTRVCLDKKSEHSYVLDWCKDKSDKYFCTLEESDTAAILFTSGTTGNPKGVMITHKNFTSDVLLGLEYIDASSIDVFYLILPLHHAFTMLVGFIASFTIGALSVFGSRLAVQSVLSDLKRGKITIFLAVPMVFNKLIQGVHKTIDKLPEKKRNFANKMLVFSSKFKQKTGKSLGKLLFKSALKKLSMDKIHFCIAGGGPLPNSTYKDFNALGVNFIQAYGLTETSPGVAIDPLDAYKENSVGKVLSRTEIKIVNPDSEGNGIIFIKGPMVMKGYYKNKKATDEVMSNGFLNSGDVGHLDKDGYLYLTGRAKNIIVTEGGKNVFPEEIEDEFQTFEEIDQILVRGYNQNDAQKIEGIEAVIKPTDEFEKANPDKSKLRAKIEAIVERINKKFPLYKRISKVSITDEKMPTSSTMKIKRFLVKHNLFHNA